MNDANLLDFSKRKGIDSDCVLKACFHVVEIAISETESSFICTRFPPTPLPIPVQNSLGHVNIGVQPVYPPAPGVVCGEFREMPTPPPPMKE